MIRTLEGLGERLFAGRTSEVYAWSDTEVVKLYQPWVAKATAERERASTQAVLDLGISVPEVGEIVSVDGRTGLILERIKGPTMMNQIESDVARAGSFARQLAEIHVAITSVVADERFPEQSGLLQARIARCESLTESARQMILASLAQMPRGDRLCHGDFHPGNIIMSGHRPVIIDWIDASRGNPAADLARSSILFMGHIAITPCSSAVHRAMELFHSTYLDIWVQEMDVDRREYEMWLPIMAAARLDEGIPEFRDWLMEQLRIP
jgi:uncharacterized protein (TIGR02172 family)